ncbi:PVC-type heme-binding CxxCH protein [Portibacter marinus]|uniref:PVC-type heme-binding CxxCH protein n=1 Tax=Portibacter marinus TaxID=2898660 RepID=UPI001F32ECD1|nr:PVC-type heme-binding CxxCH protein [Portibacter marinus]
MMSNWLRFATWVTLSTIIIAACQSSKVEVKDSEPRKIEILFLGHDQEHHHSAQYMPILASSLASEGINFTYTEDPDDINLSNLNQYDGLLVYANHDSITTPQESALLKYIESGHAFIPIHCASYCFRNSEEVVNLIGGQFKSHDTDTFTTNFSDQSHPVISDLQSFTTWDETYVHHKLADDIEVLMTRDDNGKSEPWTWVKEYGEGKVFYTAYGHDERTWSHPGFQKLVKNGILWAVSEEVRSNRDQFVTDIPELKYEEAANIPNYEKRDPAPKYQLPLSAQESKKLTQVPPGFKLELFASEPDIINPIAMNWDERGRLWVIETVDYPNTVRDQKGQGDDVIKILEDTDGDGKADSIIIFADQLNIPTSFVFFDGGVIVSQAPEFLFLKDTDGDDIADVREVMIEGWGTFDTHAGPSNLQYGIDNQVYGAVGYSGFKGEIFGRELAFRQGVFRFNPKVDTFEFLTNTSNNTWGLGITEDNSIFASTANNTHSVYLGIPNRHLVDIGPVDIKGSEKIDGHYEMQPITQNVRQVDVFGGFTAAAGHHFYTARAYPQAYWNNVAFICEPTGGLVHIAKIEKDGAGYKEKDGRNIVASADEWFSPVEAKVGPDGFLWVADWYNFIVQHNPTPSEEWGGYDAENGEGNAYVNPLRDKSHGRIWRIVPKNRAAPQITLDKNNEDQLIKMLGNDNMFWRLTAQRLLVEKENIEEVSSIKELISLSNGNDKSVIHAIWTLDGLGLLQNDNALQELIVKMLDHRSAAVRKAALQSLPLTPMVLKKMDEVEIYRDEDPAVSLIAILKLADKSPSEAIGQKLYELTKDNTIREDHWLVNAVYVAASQHAPGFATAYLQDNPNANIDEQPDFSEDKIKLDGSKLAATIMQSNISKLDIDIADYEETNIREKLVVIKSVKNEMKYDMTEFTVNAGEMVKLVFENVDFMQHNLIIVARGALEKVGQAADKLAADPNGEAMGYVPNMPEVLFATDLVDPEEKVSLLFTAPPEPGLYPFVCTFPGHWRMMQGVMKVLPSEEI